MFNDLMHQNGNEKRNDRSEKIIVPDSPNENGNLSELSASCLAVGGALLGDDVTLIGVVDDPLGLVLCGAGVTIGAIEYGPTIISTGKNVLSNIKDYIKSYSEHHKNARPSTKHKHQTGQTRKQRDKSGGEKGDVRRKRYK